MGDQVHPLVAKRERALRRAMQRGLKSQIDTATSAYLNAAKKHDGTNRQVALARVEALAKSVAASRRG